MSPLDHFTEEFSFRNFKQHREKSWTCLLLDQRAKRYEKGERLCYIAE